MRKFLTGKQGVITLQAYNLANLNACTTSNVQPCRCAHLQNINGFRESLKEEHLKITKEVFNNLIQSERNAQDEKWGEQRHSDEKWLAIAVEEVGELAEAILENNEEGLLEEIVQLAAVLQNWVTSRDFFFQSLETDN